MSEFRNLGDEELFGLLQTGVERAFTELYRRHWQAMFNGAYRRLQNREQAQDIVQNIFTDLWARRGKLEIANVPAYLHTAVRFQVFKQASREPNSSDLVSAFELNLTCCSKTDDKVREKELLELLQLWIEALPEKRRRIFLMHYFEGQATSEIAELLDVSQKTVQNQLHSASTELRARLEKILLIDFIAVTFLLE